jgi:hypothetical protein
LSAAISLGYIYHEAWCIQWRIKMFGKGQKLRKAANVIGIHIHRQLNAAAEEQGYAIREL